MKISKFIPGGAALTSIDTGPDSGKKLFLWNALPGEEILDYETKKKKSHYEEGIAKKIKNPSTHRVEPEDPCFLSTSPWQILAYPYELEQKSALVKEIFREAGLDIAAPEVVTDGKDYFYRNKMEYSLYWDKETEKISLAFHARGSHNKIKVEKSSIERPEIFKKAQEIIAELNKNHDSARRYQSLLLRCDQSGHISGGLFENGHPHPVFDPLEDAILGHTYSYSPNGFFQINLPVYELALKEIKNHIDTEKVLDLYSGVGTIGLSVARDRDLTLVECDKSAYAELENNCKNIHGMNISPVLAKSEEALDYIAPDQTVILDPPRAGCHPSLLNRLLEVAPEKIIYLSCNPITQARDIDILQEKYIMGRIISYNFFPHTPHIENLVILEKR